MIDKLIVVSLLTFLIGTKNENSNFKLEKDINDFDSFGSTIFKYQNKDEIKSIIKEDINNSYLLNNFNENNNFKINDYSLESSLNKNEYKEDYLDDLSILESKESIDFNKLPDFSSYEETPFNNNYIIKKDYEVNKDLITNHEELYDYKDSFFIDKTVFDTLNNKNYSFIDNNPNKSIKNKLTSTDFSYSFDLFIN